MQLLKGWKPAQLGLVSQMCEGRLARLAMGEATVPLAEAPLCRCNKHELLAIAFISIAFFPYTRLQQQEATCTPFYKASKCFFVTEAY